MEMCSWQWRILVIMCLRTTGYVCKTGEENGIFFCSESVTEWLSRSAYDVWCYMLVIVHGWYLDGKVRGLNPREVVLSKSYEIIVFNYFVFKFLLNAFALIRDLRKSRRLF